MGDLIFAAPSILLLCFFIYLMSRPPFRFKVGDIIKFDHDESWEKTEYEIIQVGERNYLVKTISGFERKMSMDTAHRFYHKKELLGQR